MIDVKHEIDRPQPLPTKHSFSAIVDRKTIRAVISDDDADRLGITFASDDYDTRSKSLYITRDEADALIEVLTTAIGVSI